jgi:hypothetical protein
MEPEDPSELAKRIFEARDRMARRFPDVDPGDLLLIVESVLRARSKNRRFFVRRLPQGGGYVP